MVIGRALLLSFLAVGACAPASSNDSDFAPAPPIDDKGDGTVDETTPHLAARYGLSVDYTVTVQKQNSDPSSRTFRFIGLVSARQNGTKVALELASCQLDLPVIDEKQLTLDEDAIRKLAPVSIAGIFDQGALRTDPAALQLGLALKDPLTDAVPTDEDDPAVIDIDEDDAPGASLHYSGFRVYLGARFISTLAGKRDSDKVGDPIHGDTTIETDYALYGDSVPFYDAAQKLKETLAKWQVLSKVGHFEAVPLAATATCSDVIPSR